MILKAILASIVFLSLLNFAACSQFLVKKQTNASNSAFSTYRKSANHVHPLQHYLDYLHDELLSSFDEFHEILFNHPGTLQFDGGAHLKVLESLLAHNYKMLTRKAVSKMYEEKPLAFYVDYVIRRVASDINKVSLVPGLFYGKLIEKLVSSKFPARLVSLQQPETIITFLQSTAQYFDNCCSFKIELFEKVLRSCPEETLVDSMIIFFVQSYIKAFGTLIFTIDVDRVLHLWNSYAFVIPIHFALLNYAELNNTRIVLESYIKHINASDGFMLRLRPSLHYLDFVIRISGFSSTNLSSSDSSIMELKCKTVEMIKKALYPKKDLFTILMDLYEMNVPSVFALFISFQSKEYFLSQDEAVALGQFIMLSTMSHFSIILTEDQNSIALFDKFDYDPLVLTMAQLSDEDLMSLKLFGDLIDDPKVSPLAYNVVVTIARHINIIVKAFLEAPEDFIKSKNYNFDSVDLSLSKETERFVERSPIILLAARIYLYKKYNIPLMATGLTDTPYEDFDWIEAIGFMKIMLNKFEIEII